MSIIDAVVTLAGVKFPRRSTHYRLLSSWQTFCVEWHVWFFLNVLWQQIVRFSSTTPPEHQLIRIKFQGYSFYLERFGLEAVSRCFSLSLVSILKVERLGLESSEKSNVSVLRVQHLGLEDITSRSSGFSISVSRVWKIQCLGLDSVLRVQRLGLEDATSQSRVSWLYVMWTSLQCIRLADISQRK